MSTVLTILAEGFEEAEAVTPIDVLRRAGAEVTLATIGTGIHITGRNGMTMHADTMIGNVENADFDCIFLPGGPGVKLLRDDPRVRAIVRRHAEAGKWIAAICAAPTVLHDIGLLDGRRYTAHFSVANELTQIVAGERVVIDGKIITSRGAGTALDFGLALVEQLFSAEKSSEVSRSICA